MQTRVTRLLGTRLPIVQAGMSWASSNVALPAAVSNAGALGVLAAGPMREADFCRTLDQLAAATDQPYAVNIPLYRPQSAQLLDAMAARKVPVIMASQGGPKAHLARFHDYGAVWIQVVSTLEHARKAAQAGVDALVVVGAEAGGHPPANEVSTLVTVRRVLQEVSIPVIAGGGVADGWGIAALLALGADAVQLGTRFLLTEEAGVHPNYKAAVLAADVHDTVLVGRRSLPVRGIRNAFAQAVLDAERDQISQPEYEALFQRSTLKQAALDGDVEWGKVELGQSAGLVSRIEPAAQVVQQLAAELAEAMRRMQTLSSVQPGALGA
ncbi:2-nitropropane dioxygenase [Bordetella trematum]|uniref:2-nitropropane dioxygenase n=1 Tax=Bordetella trematum TaxID=123899 RepID=A0A157SJU4_9BORD|nr:nitronate monooxygenase [Bordetella trematum]AUL46503.1 2-nitropropane dioxygenase [Bordetella trematum]AZR93300.1 2-nitropropane dioxygenase [Bordetella trematum]NNH20579.1 2-nitropropane dioxygenase [Bordetella trematum]SAI20295.1 2-nitropropane dioxygenase [Bordetella trematum]SAI24174.1 2-nitropropane dioxygenase [Bordetella trematum]